VAVGVVFLLSLALWFTHCEQHGVPISLNKKLVIGVICALLGPTYHNLLFGQINFVVLATCLGFFVLADQGRPRLAGLMLATGIWAKLYPLLLCVVAVRDRRSFLAVLWTVAFLLLIALLLLPLVPARMYAIYFGDLLPEMSRYIILDPMNQSLEALIARLRPAETANSWRAQQLLAWVEWLNLLVLCGSALLLVGVERANPLRNRICINACLLVAMPMFSPLGWGYTYALALPVLACV
jgi:hypothetical protein